MSDSSSSSKTTPRTRRGLLIVDHGSRNLDAQAALVRLAAQIGETRTDWLVEPAHMELAAPDFDAGIDALVTRGATRIHVHLHFLSAGYHVRESIPELLAKARERHPTIWIETSEPIGHDARMVDLIVERIDRVELQDRVDLQSSNE